MFNVKFVPDTAPDNILLPVFELLDEGKYDLALEKMTDLLSENQDRVYFKVVRGYILLQLGREEEAKGTLDGLEKLIVTRFEHTDEDIRVTSLLMMFLRCLQELNEFQMVAEILEHQAKKTNSEVWYKHYVMSLLQIGDYKKVYETAVQMSNEFDPKRKVQYIMWALGSLILQYQGFIGPLDYESSKLVQLAIKMSNKVHKELSFQSDLEKSKFLVLYIQIMVRHSADRTKLCELLVEKNKQEDPINWYFNKLHEVYCDVIYTLDMKEELFKYLTAICKAFSDYQVMKQIVDFYGNDEAHMGTVAEFVEGARENCNSYEMALGSIYWLENSGHHFTEEEKLERVNVDLLVALSIGMPLPRFDLNAMRPYLKKYLKDDMRNLASGVLAAALSKIKTPVSEMTEVHLIEDLNCEMVVRVACGSEEFDVHDAVKQANIMFGTYYRLSRALKQESQKLAFIGKYLSRYILAIATGLVSAYLRLTATEDMNELTDGVHMLGKFFINPNLSRGDERLKALLLAAIFVMEFHFEENGDLAEVKKDETTAVIRFLLAKWYHRLGNLSKMYKVLNDDEINYLAWEQSGYLALPWIITGGDYSQAIDTLARAEIEYILGAECKMERVIKGYYFCDFEAVEESSIDHGQVMSSTQYGTIAVEKLLLQLQYEITDMGKVKSYVNGIAQKVEHLKKISFKDSRDLTVLENMVLRVFDQLEVQEETAADDKNWFMMRLTLLEVVMKLVTFSPESTTKDKSVLDVEDLIESWKVICDKWRKYDSKVDKKGLYAVFSDEYVRWLKLAIPDFLISEATCVVKLLKASTHSEVMACLEEMQELIQLHQTQLIKLLKRCVATIEKTPISEINSAFMVHIRFVVEYMALSKIFVAVMANCVRKENAPRKIQFKKKGKAKPSEEMGQLPLPVMLILDTFRASLTAVLGVLGGYEKLLAKHTNLSQAEYEKWCQKNFKMGPDNLFLMKAFPTKPTETLEPWDGSVKAMLSMFEVVKKIRMFLINIEYPEIKCKH